MSQSIRVLKKQWVKVADFSCTYQVEGERVECYVAESADEPTSAPDKNKAGTVAFKTIYGGHEYLFTQVEGITLWAYPAGNGAVIVVNARLGATATDDIRLGQRTAFSEVKVAGYEAFAAWTFPYNINPRIVATETENGGSATHSAPFAVLQTGTNAAGSARIRTRFVTQYQPGVGGLVRFTALYTEGVANSAQIVGVGDEDDGLFFGYAGSEFGIIRRTGGTDHFTAQANWNVAAFVDFDATKLNVFQIQYQWLGAGEIRFYIEQPSFGGFVLVHRIKYANQFTMTSFLNPSLPVSAQALNSGNTTNLTLKTPSATSGIEGARDNPAQRALFGAEAKASVSDEVPVLSIRNQSTYQTIENRLTIRVEFVKVGAAGNSNTIVTFRVYIGGALTGAAWEDVEANQTPAQFDETATVLTGGVFVASTEIPGEDHDTMDFGGNVPFRVPAGEIVTVTAEATTSVDVGVSINFNSEV